jgi:hypothetical protein
MDTSIGIIKKKTPIFAYLRRSTAKIEQSESLIQQEDGIDSIVRKLWYEKEEIKYFAETYSGFENKKRKHFTQMLNEIDKSKEPCIILARDLSRLSRNPNDSLEIMNRLYGDNKNKKKVKIWKIIYLEYDIIKEITKDFDKEELHKKLSAWYYDSLDTRRKSIGWILLKLEKWEFTYIAPKWLEKFFVNEKRVLKQNDKMPFIRRAFEMKAEWKNHQEISLYLKQVWGVKLSDRELTDRLFKNTIYIWEYTEKTTGNYYTWLVFFEWKPPITRTLWGKVQKVLQRRNSQYGAWQEGNVISEKLRTESGKRMSTYLAKGKYINYKNTIDKIHISEVAILQSFLVHIWTIVTTITQINDRVIDEILSDFVDGSNERINAIYAWLPPEWRAFQDAVTQIYRDGCINDVTQKYLDMTGVTWDIFIEDITEWLANMVKNTAPQVFTEIIKSSSSLDNLKWDRKAMDQNIERLVKQKEKIELQKRDYRRNAVLAGFSKEEIDRESSDMDKAINLIESEISEFTDDTDIEAYLIRLPEVLSKTFELASNAIFKSKTQDMKDDLLKLIEITTFELTVNNKKELKIKLFEVLDRLVSGDNYILEAPSGVEPDYKALQASA